MNEPTASQKHSVEQVVSGFTDEEVLYHKSMIDAGYTPSMVGGSLIYTKPAVVVAGTAEQTEPTITTPDGSVRSVMQFISL